MQLNLHHLRYFRAVAHTMSLTRAAEALNLSASALSAQLRELEARLGHPLFERRGRGLVLTEAGRIALDHAEAIARAEGELVATLRRRGQPRQTLRVGALATLSRNFQLAFLRPLLGRSDVAVTLRSGSAAELFEALAGLDLDVVLTNEPPSPHSAAAFLLHRQDEQAASLIGVPRLVPPGVPLAARLVGAPLLLPPPGSALRLSFEALAARLGLVPQVAADVDDMAMLRLLAREGAGLAVLPPIVVRDELASGALVEAERLPELRETFYAVTRARRFPNPLLGDLLNAATAAIASTGVPDGLEPSRAPRAPEGEHP